MFVAGSNINLFSHVFLHLSVSLTFALELCRKTVKSPKQEKADLFTNDFYKKGGNCVQTILTDVISACTQAHRHSTPWPAKVSCE